MAKSHTPTLRQIPDFFTKAQKLSSQHFVCYYLFSSQFRTLETAVIAPSSAFSTLVERNACKRRIKEVVRGCLREKAPVQTGMIAIYIKKIGQNTPSFSQTKAEADRLLERVLS